MALVIMRADQPPPRCRWWNRPAPPWAVVLGGLAGPALVYGGEWAGWWVLPW